MCQLGYDIMITNNELQVKVEHEFEVNLTCLLFRKTNVVIQHYSNQLPIMHYVPSELWSGSLEPIVGVFLCASTHTIKIRVPSSFFSVCVENLE